MALPDARKSASILEQVASDRLGARIRRLRRDRNLTLDQLAAASGVSRGALSNIERGAQNPSLIAVVRIALALGLSTAQLIGEEQGPAASHVDADQAARFIDRNTGYERRLYPAFRGDPVELIRHLIPPGVTSELLGPHESGTEKYIYAEAGVISVEVGSHQYLLHPHDALQFPADRSHRFANPGDIAAAFVLLKLKRR